MGKKVEINVGKVSSVNAIDEGVAVSKTTDLPKETAGKADEKQHSKNDNNWFIGVVKARHEKKIKEKLGTLGIESFVATRETIKISPQGRKRKSEIVVIPQKIFIYCSDKERRYILDLHLGVLRFLVNIAGVKDNFGNSPLATISKKQLEDFQNILNNSPAPVDFNEYCFVKGDKVRIKSGILKGVEGIASEYSQGRTKIFINIEGLGSASTEIDTNIVEIIQ